MGFLVALLMPASFCRLVSFASSALEAAYAYVSGLGRWQDTLGLVGAAEHNESKPKTDQGSLPTKPIGEGPKDGACKVDRAPVV